MKATPLIAVSGVLIGLIIGLVVAPQLPSSKAQTTTKGSGACPDGGQPAYWVAPMDASYRRDEPGKSPMGMDLVPYCESAGSTAAVTISPAIEQNLGVRTELVRRDMLGQTIRAVGTVGWNENTLLHMHTRAEGWIEQLGVATAGDTVAAGDLLYSLYSPKLYAAEADYLASTGNRMLREAAASRLRALGYTGEQVQALGTRSRPTERMTTMAPASLAVVELGVRAGQFVTPGSMIMVLADPTQVWLTVQVAERDAARVQSGMSAQASVAAWPGRTWEGVVDQVYPELDPVTRTLRVRLAFANPDQALKPHMYAAALIDTGPAEHGLVIPANAVIRGGPGDRVVKSLGDGRFDVVAVKVGHVQNDQAQVIEGLAEGERVVSAGQFLLDSEANVDAEALRLSATEAPAGMAEATVLDVDADSRNILLEHGDFTPMGARGMQMPGMTMGFGVAEQVDLQGLQPGDQVHVVVENPGPGIYTVRELHRMPGKMPAHEGTSMQPRDAVAPSATPGEPLQPSAPMSEHHHD